MARVDWEIVHGNNLHVLKNVKDEAFDVVITDPPYGLGFMNRDWDYGVPGPEFWEEFLRVSKPGSWLVAFGGSRTFHRMASAIEDSGWEYRDTLMWLYGQGMPKGPKADKLIDAHLGAERQVVGYDATRARPNRKYNSGAIGNIGGSEKVVDRSDNGATITVPATPEAQAWEDWGTCLKPCHEPIVLARKPFSGTLAENLLLNQTGALNIGACRLPNEGGSGPRQGEASAKQSYGDSGSTNFAFKPGPRGGAEEGRWPPNVLVDEIVSEMLGEVSKTFYCPKAPTAEREAGITREAQVVGDGRKKDIDNQYQRGKKLRRNAHPTIKPLELMRWLVRLVSRPGQLILDPFIGSGTTAIAAVLEGRHILGIDENADYVEIARQRVAHWEHGTP